MSQPRILIIEDEAPIRRFLAIALGAGGFEVIEAEWGRSGIELAATAVPDAVLLDLGLPDIDGKAVISGIREWSQVPILVLSVRDGEAEKIAALDAGADDYVTKPFATGSFWRAFARSSANAWLAPSRKPNSRWVRWKSTLQHGSCASRASRQNSPARSSTCWHSLRVIPGGWWGIASFSPPFGGPLMQRIRIICASSSGISVKNWG